MASLEYLFEKQVDFDADSCQPHCTFEDYDKNKEREEYELQTPYNPARDKTDFDDYFRRLEDVYTEYLEDYLSNLVYTVFHKGSSNGAIQFDANHYLQPTLLNVEDDSVTELADLQLRGDPNDWSMQSKNNAIANLPYVVKRLHNLSCYCGIHMLSLISSYLGAKKENELKRQTGSTMLLKKNAVIGKCVYKCERDGSIGGQITVSSKSKKASDMFDWLEGNNNDYPSYREDFVNLVQYCDILNIDLINDDMSKYDKNFMNKLTVLTLTPDTQYNQVVFDAIRDSNLLGSENNSDVCLETMNCFRDICDTNDDLFKVINEHDSMKSHAYMQLAMQLHYLWSVKMCNPPAIPDSSKYSWQGGFLHYKGEIVVLGTHLISRVSFTCPKFIISELGYCVHLSDSMYLELMTIQTASDNMRHIHIQPIEDYELGKWEKFN